MENKKVTFDENEMFKDTAKKLNSMAASQIAKMAEHGYGDDEDFAASRLCCKLLLESVNVIENLEFRINELSEEIERLKRSKKVTG